MVDYSNAYTNTDDDAEQIIANVLTKINLSSKITDNPFSSSDQTIKEVIGIINQLILELSKKNEFTQVKHKCKFSVYKTWATGETIEEGESKINSDNRYYCSNGGLSSIAPYNATENVEFTMDSYTAWASGLTITAGAYIESDKLLYLATTSGTTGTTAPTGTGIVSDGGVSWQYVRSICYWINKGTDLTKYPFSEICPDFRAMCPKTMINKTATRKISPLTDEQEQNLNVYNITTPANFYQVREGAIWLYPTYSEGDNIEFFYWGKMLIEDEDNVAKKYFTANSDIPLIPSQVLIYGACYQWKMMKQMDYAKYETLYNEALEKALADNKEPYVVSLDGHTNDNYSPVPFQDWTITGGN
jgi:hypothetical protein